MATRLIYSPAGRMTAADVARVHAGAFAQRQSPSVILIGDSKTAYNGGTSVATPVQSLGVHYDSKGPFNQANVALNHAFRVVGNAGIGGQTSAQIAARFDVDALSRPSDWVFGMAGTNDLDASANTSANIISMWDKAGAAGKNVAWLTIPPIGTAGTDYATKNPYHQQVNYALRLAALTRPWVVLIDHDQATVDAATAYLPLAGMTVDGVHESPQGAAAEGLYIASVLKDYIRPINHHLGQSSGDPYNLLSNPMLSGSGNATPTGWGKVGTGTISYVPRANRPAWTQLAQAAGASGGVTANVPIGAGLAIGDTVRCVVEFECDGLEVAPAANTQGCKFTVQAYNGSSFFANVSDLYWDTSYGNFKLPPSGVLQAPDFVVPAGTTLLQIYAGFSGGGNYRLSRAAVRNITALNALGLT